MPFPSLSSRFFHLAYFPISQIEQNCGGIHRRSEVHPHLLPLLLYPRAKKGEERKARSTQIKFINNNVEHFPSSIRSVFISCPRWRTRSRTRPSDWPNIQCNTHLYYTRRCVYDTCHIVRDGTYWRYGLLLHFSAYIGNNFFASHPIPLYWARVCVASNANKQQTEQIIKHIGHIRSSAAQYVSVVVIVVTAGLDGFLLWPMAAFSLRINKKWYIFQARKYFTAYEAYESVNLIKPSPSCSRALSLSLFYFSSSSLPPAPPSEVRPTTGELKSRAINNNRSEPETLFAKLESSTICWFDSLGLFFSLTFCHRLSDAVAKNSVPDRKQLCNTNWKISERYRNSSDDRPKSERTELSANMMSTVHLVASIEQIHCICFASLRSGDRYWYWQLAWNEAQKSVLPKLW